MSYTFQEESVKVIFSEGVSLMESHYAEVPHFTGGGLDVDVERYLAVEGNGAIKVYTARHEDGHLVGYSVYFVTTNLHKRSLKQAAQDVIYISPDHRGFGRGFIEWCERQLKECGVSAVYTNVKVNYDWGHMLEKIGYKKIEVVYGKEL